MNMGTSPEASTAAGQGDAGSGASRKDRLEALKARRQVLATSTPEVTLDMRAATPPPLFVPRPTPRPVAAPSASAMLDFEPDTKPGFTMAKAQTALRNAPPQMQSNLKQFGAKILQLLTRTPADGSGLVERTPFTMTGVAKFAGMLAQKAKDPSGPGGKPALMALKFLEEPDTSKPTAHGLSIEKLQMLAKRIAEIQKRPGALGPAVMPMVAPVARPAAPVTPAAAIGGGKRRSPAANQAGRPGAAERQRRQVERALQIMVSTPDDGTGMVEGTSFSKAGVALLKQTLTDRANGTPSRAADGAADALREFAAAPDETEVVHGMSVKKLQTLAGRG
jgi:hypothetical protein